MPQMAAQSDSALQLVQSLLHESCRLVATYHGGESYVFRAVSESSSKSFCVRIPRKEQPIDHEVNIRQKLSVLNEPRIQQLLAFDTSVHNVMRSSYLILDWCPGDPLVWREDYPPQDDRDGIIHAVAQISLDMFSIRATGGTAESYVIRKIKNRLDRFRRTGQLDFASACETQAALMSKFILPDFDNAEFAVIHGDLCKSNLIVDGLSNLMGIIDFGWAEFVPLQFVPSYPKFLSKDPVLLPSGVSWPSTSTNDRDRRSYLQYIKQTAQKFGGASKQYYDILARGDEAVRHLWFRAAIEMNIFKAMALCQWNPPLTDNSI